MKQDGIVAKERIYNVDKLKITSVTIDSSVKVEQTDLLSVGNYVNNHPKSLSRPLPGRRLIKKEHRKSVPIGEKMSERDTICTRIFLRREKMKNKPKKI